MSKNDDRILELKKQIDIKKKALAEKKIKFVPETSCILNLDKDNYNLHVCTEDTLKYLLIRLNMYVMSAKDLEIETPEFNGFSVEAWMSDVKNKLAEKNVKKEEADLKHMEAKLDKLLSDDKKTELELDEIASLLL